MGDEVVVVRVEIPVYLVELAQRSGHLDIRYVVEQSVAAWLQVSREGNRKLAEAKAEAAKLNLAVQNMATRGGAAEALREAKLRLAEVQKFITAEAEHYRKLNHVRNHIRVLLEQEKFSAMCVERGILTREQVVDMWRELKTQNGWHETLSPVVGGGDG